MKRPGRLAMAISIFRPGLTSFGLIIGLLFGTFFYSLIHERKRLKEMFLKRIDLMALYLVLWGAIVNIFGCFIDGHRVGAISTLPWAVYRHGALRHPIDLYIGLLNAVIFLVLLIMFVKKG
ncbi:MAG: prolipoprotein diacylglyceryl transferase, partial [Bacillota bacterium]|nr:prolipoprotein diacylglyceryl transferase [Bacillota bacterium]